MGAGISGALDASEATSRAVRPVSRLNKEFLIAGILDPQPVMKRHSVVLGSLNQNGRERKFFS
jgi:hypothetical protein